MDYSSPSLLTNFRSVYLMKQSQDIVKGIKISIVLAYVYLILLFTGNPNPGALPLKQEKLHSAQPDFLMTLLKYDISSAFPDTLNSTWRSAQTVPGDSSGIYLSGSIISGEIITFEYKTPPSNNPDGYSNWIGIWQGSQVNFTTSPKARAPIYSTNADGDQAFDSLNISNLDYIIGYGAGPENTSVASTVFFPAGIALGAPGIPFCSSVKIAQAGSNYLVVKFSTPEGNIPRDNQNWIGIWEGKTFSYAGTGILKKVIVNATVNEGMVAVNNLMLKRDTWYTVVYGNAAGNTSIAASYTFRVS